TRDEVVRLLDTDDPQLQQEVLGIVARNPGWAGETLALLRQWLADGDLTDERAAALRGFLLAQAQDDHVQQLVGDGLARPSTSPAAQTLLLEVVRRSGLDPLP